MGCGGSYNTVHISNMQSNNLVNSCNGIHHKVEPITTLIIKILYYLCFMDVHNSFKSPNPSHH